MWTATAAARQQHRTLLWEVGRSLPERLTDALNIRIHTSSAGPVKVAFLELLHNWWVLEAEIYPLPSRGTSNLFNSTDRFLYF
jgi:hypothetical protein